MFENLKYQQPHVTRSCAFHSLEEIQRRVSKFFGVTKDELVSRSRKKAVVIPRWTAMYLMRRCTDASLDEIGHFFKRNHSTVLHAVAQMERYMRVNKPIRYLIQNLSERITKQ